MITKQDITALIRAEGPLLPVRAAQKFHVSTIIISALLSEAVREGQIRVSHLKVGSSPLYYAPGQEAKLINYKQYLHEKEQKALEMLRQKKIIIDDEVDAIVRTALKNLRDFAMPFRIKTAEREFLVWRYYLVPDDEFKSAVGELIRGKRGAGADAKKDLHAVESEVKSAPNLSRQEDNTGEQPARAAVSADFKSLITGFAREKGIEIERIEQVRKGKEYHLYSRIKTSLGGIHIILMAKNKSKITEQDVNKAYITGQEKRCPVFILSRGTLSVRAKQALGKYPNISFVNPGF